MVLSELLIAQTLFEDFLGVYRERQTLLTSLRLEPKQIKVVTPLLHTAFFCSVSKNDLPGNTHHFKLN